MACEELLRNFTVGLLILTTRAVHKLLKCL